MTLNSKRSNDDLKTLEPYECFRYVSDIDEKLFNLFKLRKIWKELKVVVNNKVIRITEKVSPDLLHNFLNIIAENYFNNKNIKIHYNNFTVELIEQLNKLDFSNTELNLLELSNMPLSDNFNKNISFKEILQKMSGMSRLKFLNQNFSTELWMDTFETIYKNFRRLIKLTIVDCNTSIVCSENLSKILLNNQGLRIINFRNMVVEKSVLQALSKCTGVQELHLWNCSISEHTACHLADALKCLRNLSLLDLGQNNLGDNGGKSILNALRDSCRSITRLGFRKCNFSCEILDILGRTVIKLKNLEE